MGVRTKIRKARDAIERRVKGLERVARITAGLTGIPSDNKDQRGFDAEEKALKAAKFWAGKGLIRRVVQIKRLSPADMTGIDLVLTLLDRSEINVQVKNYYRFSIIKRCQEAGIVPFIIFHDEGEDIAKKKMLDLIMSAYTAKLSPFQVSQAVKYILRLKQPQRSNLIGRIFSRFRKAH